MNHILKAILMAMAVVLSVVSAYLTASFLYGIGESVGLAVPFGAAGIALDTIKTFAPVAVIVLWKQSKNNEAIAGGVLTIALTILSMTASYHSIDKSVSMATANNQVTEAAKTELENLTNQLNATLDQQKVYTKAGMATKAVSLNQRLDQIRVKADKVRAEIKAAPPAARTLDHNGILAVSVAIEVACMVTLILVGSLSAQTTTNVESIRVQTTSSQVQTTTQTTTHIEGLARAKKIVLAGEVNPSERQLAKAMAIPRNQAAVLLSAMEADGTIFNTGTRRRVAEINQ